jgi:hypothetical protein
MLKHKIHARASNDCEGNMDGHEEAQRDGK